MKRTFNPPRLVDDGVRKASPLVSNLIKSLVRKRTEIGRTAVEQIYTQAVTRNEGLANILKTFSEYDAEQIHSTVMLPAVRGSHYAVEELGTLALGKKYFKHSDVVVEVVKRRYQKNLNKGVVERTLSIPRGKNTGWPLFVSGMHRLTNDVALYLYAKIVNAAHDQKMSLKDLHRKIEGVFGFAPFYMYGERFQHTAKSMPYFLRSEYQFSLTNVFPRVRMINMSDKLSVMYNRAWVKSILSVLIVDDWHNPDKHVIDKFMKKILADKSHVVLPIDHSKFDHHVGFLKAKQIHGIMAWVASKVTGDEETRIYDSFRTEYTMPKTFPYMGQIMSYEEDGYLASGASFTTIHDIIANDLSVTDFCEQKFIVMNKRTPTVEELEKFFNDSLSGQSWGDDTVFSLKKSVWGEDPEAEIFQMFTNQGYEVKREETLKYLGQVYDVYQGYPMYRFAQNTIGPERSKLKPLDRMGVVARYLLLPENVRSQSEFSRLYSAMENALKADQSVMGRMEMHPAYRTIPTLKELSDPASRELIIKEGIELAQGIAQGKAELDDILMLFHHGSEQMGLAEELLGISQKDYTLDDLDKDIAKQIMDQTGWSALGMIYTKSKNVHNVSYLAQLMRSIPSESTMRYMTFDQFDFLND